ncbi:MAG: carboxypeptidase regulatory-like domain-containing protein [Candidatus Acidiferrales bacterium]
MKSKELTGLAALFAALLLLLPFTAGAQSIVTGGLGGTVTDASGAVIAGATVTLKNADTGATLTATTTAAGTYQFTLLKPGNYTVSISHEGFKQVSQPVEVLLGQMAVANLQLQVGATTETVTVTEQGALLQTENANIATTFETRQVENLPNPGNDLTNVALTAPGVGSNTSSGNGYGNFSAFGLPGTANLFTINGNDYNDPFLNLNNSGASNLLLGTNDVQEVAVVSNGYTGQYGRQAGAQIDYSTKSGGNQYHGDAVYYWTGKALDANDYFLKSSGEPRPFQNNNQWQANFGGPIKKDKLFFFMDTEGIRYIFGTSSQVFVPTPAFENYVTTNIAANHPTATNFYQNLFSLYDATPGIGNATPVAASCPGLPGIAGGECLQSFFTSGASGNREWLLVGRVDYNLGENDKIFGRVKFDRGVQPTYADPINPAFNAISRQPQDEGQLNYTHVFSPNVVNSFIFSDLWYSAIFQSVNQSAALGVFPEILCPSDTSLSCLGPTGGEYPFGFFFPQGRNVEQWQLVDDVSVTRGNHNFKMGINFRRDDVSDYRASELNYPAVTTSLAGFANDAIDQNVFQNFSLTGRQPLAIYSFGLYFQDEFRVNSRLKFTLALRADRNSGGACQSNCGTLAAEPFNQLDHDPTTPYNQSFVTGRKSILPGVEKVVFEPRAGFAWSPFGQNTVLRGGVGLFTDLYPGTLLDNFTVNFPQVTSFAINTGSVDPSEAGSGANIIGQCNAAFQNTYNTGGNLASYTASSPAACLTPAGSPALPSLYDSASKLLNPKYVEWNFEIQHTFGPRTVGSINYVGNRGYDLILANPYLNAFGFGDLPATAPDARVATVEQFTNNGYSNYNGITASIQQNMWRGLTGRLSYTYSHALDNVSNGGVLPYSVFDSILTQTDPTNPNASYGPSDYDLRHQLSANYVWELPIKSEHRALNALIGGWQVSGTFFWHSGYPFSIVDGLTAFNIAGQNMSLNGTPVATVLAQPNVSIPRNFGSGCAAAPCFTTADFATSTTFIGGSVGRNAFRGPGYFNTDFSLRKSFRLTERLGFQVGANAFNVLNHTNFQNPVNTTTSSAFGQIVAGVSPPTTPYGAFAAAAEDMRIVQITGKLTF